MYFSFERTGIELCHKQIELLKKAISEMFYSICTESSYISTYQLFDEYGECRLRNAYCLITRLGELAFNGSVSDETNYMPMRLSINNINTQKFQHVRCNNHPYSMFVIVIMILIKNLCPEIWKIGYETTNLKKSVALDWIRQQSGSVEYNLMHGI